MLQWDLLQQDLLSASLLSTRPTFANAYHGMHWGFCASDWEAASRALAMDRASHIATQIVLGSRHCSDRTLDRAWIAQPLGDRFLMVKDLTSVKSPDPPPHPPPDLT